MRGHETSATGADCKAQAKVWSRWSGEQLRAERYLAVRSGARDKARGIVVLGACKEERGASAQQTM